MTVGGKQGHCSQVASRAPLGPARRQTHPDSACQSSPAILSPVNLQHGSERDQSFRCACVLLLWR